MTSDSRQHPFHLRYQQGSILPKDVSASADIDAPIDLVWRLLVDFDSYPDWNPFTTRVVTTLQVGEPVELHVDMPGRSRSVQTEWVNLVEPGRTVCWGTRVVHPWLLCANRWQTLTDMGDGRTRYETIDRFSGVLVPLVMALYGEPMRQGFESVAQALKKHAESHAGSAAS